MNKTTTTLLTAAGLIFLAGCKTEVMRDRPFKEGPQEDPVVQQPMQRPVEKEAVPVQQAPAPRFKPMSGEFSNEGIEDNTLCRRSTRKASGCTLAKGGVYVVKRGDTLGRIARKYGVSVQALREANNRTAAQDRFLRPGTKLVIPGGKAVKNGKGVKSAAQGRKITGKLNADGTYTIVKGDNIPKIARKFGIRARALQAANNLSDEATTRLQIGQKLVIPTGADAAVSARKSGAKKSLRKSVPAPRQVPTAAPAADDVAVTPPPAEQPAAAPAPAPVPAAGETAPDPAPAADGDTAAVLPPAAAETASAAGTQFVSVTGYKDLAEFAAKHNTTVEELCKLNPRLNPAEPLSVHEMLYVPKK